MTPSARIAAAIEILDAVLAGAPAERTLTAWARRSRFAGSGDRAAVRDHVFDALRCRRSCCWLGGAETGRGAMLGALRAAGGDPRAVFTGDGYAPPPLGAGEADERNLDDAPEGVRLDAPDWLLPALRDSLGDNFAPALQRLRSRAPVFLRVNALKGDPAAAVAALAGDGIAARPHPLSATALEVTANARRVRSARAYLDGLVELQDAASQAVVEALPVASGSTVLDLCAGGGGKALALAARGARVTAWDADPVRMRDLPARAARAGADIAVAPASPSGPFDMVLADAPCSGSGAWRRSPEAKWRLTPERLAELTGTQDLILDDAAHRVGPGGTLAYATCSLLDVENGERIGAFLARHPGWRLEAQRRLTPLDGGDGFFLATLVPG